ncbi:uncharacterized protein TDEL_0G03380 [Torulaspora delbrueckii]|uniref:Integrase catalytic domain-containing protein n=1 Tax=Torulaspora delbrueckii TaxID=4950 RepID=G8ZXT8_TORDE|nr:hypothetical protein TDEL_0G03380 [Torulaspora delbrueckii]CCE93705.1 hypothetical protein TDEL_0G03380 [Torulaspora delbrueckii]
MILFIDMWRFSKKAHFIPCAKGLDARDVIDLLYRFIFAYHVFPKSIISDRDTRLMAKLFRDFTERPGIKLTISSSNHPQTDDQSERETLNRLLRTYTNSDHALWDEIENVYSSTPSQSSRLTLFEVHCGYIPSKILRSSGTDQALENYHHPKPRMPLQPLNSAKKRITRGGGRKLSLD